MNEMPHPKRRDQTLPAEPVVILVDNKIRDLDVASLIAHHIEGLGVTCHLEPLEAFRGVLAAYRPGMIVFNHLNASHLVDWSQRLAKMGVLTAVLPNEGIAYDPEVQQYLAGCYHNSAHVDYFFCWNEAHRKALLAQGFGKGTQVEVTGVPRFDFYFAPWSKIIDQSPPSVRSRPSILFCTNFITAKFMELPRDHADALFKQWTSRISRYADYWSAIEAQCRARQRALDYLDALVEADAFNVVMRPHPNEDAAFYKNWFNSLPPERRAHVRIDSQSNISGLIFACDLEISCETCTTALESWIAGKPTIELIFERHSLWYSEIHARGNVACNDPAALPGLVERELRTSGQPEKRDIRRQHLKEWCATPDGRSAWRIARIMADAVAAKKPADWSKLRANDYRRALKLSGLRRLGLAYHFDPLLWLKRSLLPERYAVKDRGYRKSITPDDVNRARQRLNRIGIDGK